MASPKERNVVFFHPDLGIGGAERLIVDAAVGLQQEGYNVTIFTSHCDPRHCFDEARNGTLDVRVRGNTLVPPSFFNRFTILCAILRHFHLLLHITLFTRELRGLQPSAFIVDQLSAGVPFLRFLSPRAYVLFYCHFPDKLLAHRESWIKRVYRIPFDFWEGWSMGCSDEIVVNSEFTRGIFGQAFPRLHKRQVGVVYPCVDVPTEKSPGKNGNNDSQEEGRELWKGKRVILSINRFERKKDVGLAIRAFAGLSPQVRHGCRLVVAGGYDPRMVENVSYHTELSTLATSLDLKTATAKNLVSALAIPQDIDVLFLLSVPSSLKDTLLQAADLLVYTPKFEHFGIVPLEAMLAGKPVLAAKTGGPKETIVDGVTGWLRDADVTEEWTEVMRSVLVDLDETERDRMGREGRQRVTDRFSRASMARRFDEVIRDMLKRQSEDRPKVVHPRFYDLGAFVLGVAIVLAWKKW